ncbi:MAG: metal ABC transporter permease [Gammaproteobacteria bacterium]|nr:metal ABC transporter permease [Gammaproteobacteria bacterium]
MELTEQLLIIAPALVAGIVVMATHLPLGQQVLKRGIIFIDLAIAQIAAIGAMLVALFIHEHSWLEWFIPLAFAIAGALLIALLEQRIKAQLEAFIGVIYIGSAAAGSMLVAASPHGQELLHSVLSGQILWTDWSTLWIPAGISAALVALLAVKPALLQSRWFYPIFAIAITLSVQIIGVYLVFATLIVPALAANSVTKAPRTQLLLAGLVGILGYTIGLLSSLGLDLPSGPTIVLSLIVLGTLLRVSKVATRTTP